jgi:hypothetical protein
MPFLIIPLVYFSVYVPYQLRPELVIKNIQNEVIINPEGNSQIFTGSVQNKGRGKADNVEISVRWSDGLLTYEKSAYLGQILPEAAKRFIVAFNATEVRRITSYSQWTEHGK